MSEKARKVKADSFEDPEEARRKKGFTYLKNYGQGSSTLKVEYGKKAGEKLYQDRMFRLMVDCDCGKKTKLILNADQVSKVIRYV